MADAHIKVSRRDSSRDVARPSGGAFQKPQSGLLFRTSHTFFEKCEKAGRGRSRACLRAADAQRILVGLRV